MEFKASANERPELVFALVAPIGARVDDLSRAIQKELQTFGYSSSEIHLSRLLRNFTGYSTQAETDEFNRIKYLQKMGNDFCRTLNDRAALARSAIAEIRAARKSLTDNPGRPASAHAYILNQLKRPEEVDLLRQCVFR